MTVYTKDIITALIAFPFFAAIFTLPYMIIQYRKYGSLPLLRVLIVYSFILYLLCMYFMVILPLPGFEEAAAITEKMVQLVPFRFLADFFSKSGFVITRPGTYLAAFKSAEFYVPLFNILLTVPFGIYLKYYFRKKWPSVLLISFLLSLFFELTQLSALYGIYPHAYRLFDVDDLILNTFGGLCGYWISPLFEKILPSRDKIDEIAFRNAERVSITRRLVAVFIDYNIISCITAFFPEAGVFEGLSKMSFAPGYFIGIAVVFFICPLITDGYTPGKACVGIRLRSTDGEKPKKIQYIIRYFLLYVIEAPALFWCVLMLSFMDSETILADILLGISSLFFLVVFFKFVAHVIKTFFKKQNFLVYEKLSKTINVNTVRKKEA